MFYYPIKENYHEKIIASSFITLDGVIGGTWWR
jgi:hypothetical protein